MAAILVTGAAAGVVGGRVATVFQTTDSGALLNSQTNLSDNAITMGTVSIDGPASSTALTIPAMMPGDTQAFTVPVKNGGTVPLRYRVKIGTVTGAPALANALNVTTSVTGAGGADGAGTPGHVAAGAFLLGNTAQQERVVAPGGQDTITVTISLPSTADNTLQGLGAAFTLSFLAEQTANNPFAPLS